MFRIRSLPLSALLGLVVSATSAVPASAVDITEWGSVVPDGATGVLQNDLDGFGAPGRCRPGGDSPCITDDDCSPAATFGCVLEEVGVTLRPGAKLDLNGFRILDSRPSGTRGVGVYCLGDRAEGESQCEIAGPGGLEGLRQGIIAGGREEVVLSDLLIQGNDIVARSGSGRVRDRYRLTNVSFVSNRSPFLTAKQIDGTNVQAYDSAIDARFVNLDGFVSSFAEHVGVAVIGRRVTLANSTLSGSRVADIRSKRRPVLVNATCERSEKRYGGPTWGVCSND